MHSYKRADRVGPLMRKEVSDIILNEINDPRIDKLRTTVTQIELSKDLKNATIKISVMGDEEKSKQIMQGLESAKGYIRREIGKRIRLRHTPEIRFVLDHSVDYIMKVDELLRGIGDEIQDSN